MGKRGGSGLGLSISLGMIARLERQATVELEAPVEQLRDYVRRADSAHIDETSWKQGRAKAWLWAAVTRLVTVFAIATSRGADVASRPVRPPFEEILRRPACARERDHRASRVVIAALA